MVAKKDRAELARLLCEWLRGELLPDPMVDDIVLMSRPSRVVMVLSREATDDVASRLRTLLAFGDDGTGNPFCVPLDSEADEVLRWNWFDQDVEANEGGMDHFLRTWLASG